MSLAAGALVGVVAALVWAMLGWSYLWVRRRCEFGHLCGDYAATTKVENAPTEWTVSIRKRYRVLKGNRFRVAYHYQDRADRVAGEIAMDETLPMHGEGRYTHHVAASDAEGWGGWRILDASPVRKLYVDTTFTGGYGNKPPIEVTRGYVWTQTRAEPDALSRLVARIQHASPRRRSDP